MNHKKSAEDVKGLEYDWIACDVNGFVGLFSTAGGGYTPAAFLDDTAAHDAAIDAILALPASTRARFAPQLPPNLQNTWQLVAERGLFAFDSDVHGGPYRQVAAPIAPIHVDDLPQSARSVARAITLRRVRFDSHPNLPADLLT